MNEPLPDVEQLFAAAVACREQSQLGEAQSIAEQALERAVGDGVLRGRALNLMGQIALDKGDHLHALSQFTEALALFRQASDARRVAIATGNVGLAYQRLFDFANAAQYLTEALGMCEESGDAAGAARHMGNLANLYYYNADYPNALDYYHRALAIEEQRGDMYGIALHTGNIGNVYLALNDYDNSLDYYRKALALNKKTSNQTAIAVNLSNIGGVYASQAEYPKALESYEQALDIVTVIGDAFHTYELLSNIGVIRRNMGEYERALEQFRQALTITTEIGNKLGIADAICNIGNVYYEEQYDKWNAAEAESHLLNALELYRQTGVKSGAQKCCKMLADLYFQTGDGMKAYRYFQIFYDVEKQVQTEEAHKRAEQLAYERKTAEREKQIAVERIRHESTEQLLNNILPPSIAEKMLQGETLIAEKIESVSVIFADIVGFTGLSQQIPPEQLVQGLNAIFSAFDEVAGKYGLEKIKTMGDSYLAICGAPVFHADHPLRAAAMAVEMMEATTHLRLLGGDTAIRLRIGIHTGEIVAGVIGKRKFAYDIWGDAVNTASRMESHGEPGKIHVSAEFMRAVAALPDAPVRFVERGIIPIKGKGMMQTYFMEAAG